MTEQLNRTELIEHIVNGVWWLLAYIRHVYEKSISWFYLVQGNFMEEMRLIFKKVMVSQLRWNMFEAWNTIWKIWKLTDTWRVSGSFYETRIILIPKPNKKRKLSSSISHEEGSKNHQKILANQILKYMKRIIHYNWVGFIPGMQ